MPCNLDKNGLRSTLSNALETRQFASSPRIHYKYGERAPAAATMPPNLLQPLTRRTPATTVGGGPPQPTGSTRAEHSARAARRQQTSQPGKVGEATRSASLHSPPGSAQHIASPIVRHSDPQQQIPTEASTQLPPTSQRMPADNILTSLQQCNNYNENITTTTVNSTTTMAITSLTNRVLPMPHREMVTKTKFLINPKLNEFLHIHPYRTI
uniref:Uncharacterized protein n=1 Tax=Glossina morsitans morsitans TaxID=37546 RepID=A0A1B0F9C2_GLOMM